MKEYQFQYTKIWSTLLIFLGSMTIFILMCFVFAHLKLNEVIGLSMCAAITILLFRLFKSKVIYRCTARISDTSIEFIFDDSSRIINFEDLYSFKIYDGKAGTILTLNTGKDKFRLTANNSLCKTANFEAFCKDILTTLNNYKATHNVKLVQSGSIYETKGMLYFLNIATVAYLLGFFFETKPLRVAIGIGGGMYLFFNWLGYYVNNTTNKKRS